jgi:hypothetical protein
MHEIGIKEGQREEAGTCREGSTRERGRERMSE